MITIRKNRYGYRVLDTHGDELGCADTSESGTDDHVQVITELLDYLKFDYKIEESK